MDDWDIIDSGLGGSESEESPTNPDDRGSGR
jgi:hypothetical protein